MASDEDALTCDFVEYYHILDWRALPVKLAATLCAGLSPNSRTKLRLAGLNTSFDTFLLSGIYDRLSLLVWFQSKDGAAGRNRPKAITPLIMQSEKKSEVQGFASGKDFDEEWKRLTKGNDNGD